MQNVTSSWFFLSTLNYDARSTAHQIYSTNNTKHSKYKYTFYQNTHIHTQPHITKQVKPTTIQYTPK